MAYNFSKQFTYEGKNLLAVIVPELRKDGMYYEVNIKGHPRFKMTWSALGRYDIIGEESSAVPYGIVLIVSDIIEEENKK